MIKILQGDCVDGLRTLPDASVHCVVTSPPYWGLRDYGQDGQIGLEETPEAYVARMVEVFREVRRVLRDDGTCWLNLGDSYANSGSADSSKVGGFPGDRIRRGVKGIMDSRPRNIPNGLKPKDLVGIPWRVAFALQADGWWLRQDIIWHKPNPMPESVTDRCTKAHEYVFLLTKSAKYFYDNIAIAEEAQDRPVDTWQKRKDAGAGTGTLQYGHNSSIAKGAGFSHTLGNGSTRNRRSVWTVATKPFSGAHFAVMPPDLVEPCLLAGTSEKGCCVECGAPWERLVERETRRTDGRREQRDYPGAPCRSGKMPGSNTRGFHQHDDRTTGWQPTCTCNTDTTPCTVLDPFGGAGTTALVADRLGRDAIICELNPEYVQIAVDRMRGDNPLFVDVQIEACKPAPATGER